ncbi:YrrS family protein [Bacillus sp. AGMB 02131]|uniref:YrrS family protein n=1 Tax=Peribacillus faecalis TaxID=2772559 RepID=A0A927CXI7_9BACI|nr:YrrS family protein [Peribacillus faecalis]MBD3109547.1 YrrS family protein [Peribacillus faecalis]
MDNDNNSKLGSRSENRGKKRKANRIYNILLAIVIVAIIVVAIPIFTSRDDDQTNKSNDTTSSQNKTADNEEANTETDSAKEDATEENTKEDTADEAEDKDTADEEETQENTVVENSGDSNVAETYVNDSWKPVGTTQSGEHVTNFSTDSVDWQEMKQAIALGAGVSTDNMTVWYIGNGGTNKAIGTVSAKDDSMKTYRVYIEWIDGQGWKPEKVELLKQNDKR